MTAETHQQTVIKTGNSLAVVIPATFAKKTGLKAGDKVQVNLIPHQGKIICNFPHIRQLSLV